MFFIGMLVPDPMTGLFEIVEMEDMKEVVIRKKAPLPMLWLKALGLVGGRALLGIFGRVPSSISNVYVARSLPTGSPTISHASSLRPPPHNHRNTPSFVKLLI
jgi:hypothetical protein